MILSNHIIKNKCRPLLQYQMKSGFVQLVVKRVMAGRSVSRGDSANRFRAIDSFKKFINNSLPEMQEAIEIQLLKKNLTKIKDPSVRTQLINAYLRRLYRVRAYEHEQMKSYKQLKAVQPQQILTIKDPTILKDITEHTEYDIGSYVLFTKDDMNRVFKHGCFGRYSLNQYWGTLKFGIQIREESLSIGEVIKHIDNNYKNKEKVNWQNIKKIPDDQILDHINDEIVFPALFMELSNAVYQKVQQYRSHPEYYRVWGSSTITDIIVSSVLQNQKYIKSATETVISIVEEVMKIQPLPSPNDFYFRFRTIPGFNHIKTQTELPQNVRHFCRTPSLKSFFLGGEGGSGKSMILAYLAMLAHKKGWIVVNVPDAYKWTQDRKAVYPRAYNGLYLINQHAVQWLDQFYNANSQILKSKPVNNKLYGQFDITGVRVDQAEPVPNIYYSDRKTYFNEVSQKFQQRIVQKEQQYRRQAKKRLTDVLKSPKNIGQIASAGIENPQYATCAMGQILEQVYSLDHPTIECVDSFSYLYRATYYPSFRYYNDRDLWGKVPPYHVAHCRMFNWLDGHKLKNGIKVVASSNYHLYKHKFNIKQMMFPENYEHKVRNLNQAQFKKAGAYNILNNWWFADEVQRHNLSYAYTITQGNWGDFQELMRLGHYY